MTAPWSVVASRSPAFIVCCRQCWQSRPGRSSNNSAARYARSYSTAATTTATPTLQAPVARGVVALASRRLLAVAGPDALKFLQNMLTANLTRLEDRPDGTKGVRGLYAAFLSAQGRGADDPRAAYLIEVDAEQAATLEKHIRRYRLRSKLDVRVLDGGGGGGGDGKTPTVWHAWGGDDEVPFLEEHDDAGQEQTVPWIALRDVRAPGLGWRYITGGDAAAAPAATTTPPLPLPVADETAYRVHRYLLGVAEGQREMLRDQALPLESNLDVMGAIDFHKGCYVGQELTIRTRHRGVVRKRILPCVVYSDGGEAVAAAAVNKPDALTYAPTVLVPPTDTTSGTAAAAPAAVVVVDAETVPAETSIGRVAKRGRSAGKWLRGVGNLGLALCRLETMTDVVPSIGAGAGVAATAAATAVFDPASEFSLNVQASSGAAAAVTPSESTTATTAAAAAATTATETTEAAMPALKIKAFVPDWLRQGLAEP
ncbi:aminomethyltransferase [Niveomyces insectorum RCEF 264]|uniref:Iron-sulfur cluster assembly factor IBA57 homolog, mitochondrial n=1 Tax=Niveomyces insectorum RCEF 264 TaxID=1081102 RepID=A0A167N123_9HYPO|nr:aminomethyltransferase [Niveomyces insectorum RCEF 264]